MKSARNVQIASDKTGGWEFRFKEMDAKIYWKDNLQIYRN